VYLRPTLASGDLQAGRYCPGPRLDEPLIKGDEPLVGRTVSVPRNLVSHAAWYRLSRIRRRGIRRHRA
jgi:hypothetical protein